VTEPLNASERPPAADAPADAPADAALEAVAGAGQQLRAPWAASVAGILFALLFTAALLLMRGSPLAADSNREMAQLFAEGRDQWLLVGGLYLAPFAGIMFLWFVAVVRDQIGEREDRFFATVFFGSGLIFVALLFVSAAVASAPIVGVRYMGQGSPLATDVGLFRALSYTVLFAFATRAAGVFLIATATIGLRSGAFPKWVAWTGFALGLVLLVVVTFWDWAILVLPAWVAVVSIFILLRERSRSRVEGR